MPQRSKLIRSRDEWKNRAVSRANEIRDRRKAEKRLRGRIAELERQVEELKQAAGSDKILQQSRLEKCPVLVDHYTAAMD